MLGVPNIIDFAIPPAKSGPCSLIEISIVDRKITGNTEKIPLIAAPMFESETAIAIIVPASKPRKIIFVGV